MRPPLCPVCRKPAVAAYRPFCSRRCADVDLQRWLAGVHRLGGDEGEGDGTGEAGEAGARGPPDPPEDA